MLEYVLTSFRNYENYILTGLFVLFLLLLWQTYYNVRSNYLSSFRIFFLTGIVNGASIFASVLAAKYLILFPLEKFTSYCFNYGKSAYLLIFIFYVWFSVVAGHLLTRLLFRQFNYGFQRGKRFTSVLASFYLPTIIGIFFMIATDCAKDPWFGWQSYHHYGTVIFLVPNLFSFIPQIFITTQYIDKKKKVRQQ